MDVVGYIIVGVMVVVFAILSLRQNKENRGKSYEQRRDELFEYSQKRVEEYRQTKTTESESPEED